MFGIKVTPFILFLILLITLVISMLFGNSWLLSNKNRREGFVSYGYTNSDLMRVTLSPYSSSKQVIYLYDNLYFDGDNANLIEVDSPYCGNVRVNGATIGNIKCNDSTGSTISNLWITNSVPATSQFQVSGTVNPGVTALATRTTTSQIAQTMYLSSSTQLSKVSRYRYQVFTAYWGTDTYLHLLGLDPNAQNGMNIESFFYNSAGNMMRSINYTPTSYTPNYNSVPASNMDQNNGKLYNDTGYAQNGYSTTVKIYQLSAYVKYDIVNGNVLIGASNGRAYAIYDRATGNSKTLSSSTGSIQNLTTFNSWSITDGNNGLVVVMAFGLQTVIMILNSDPNNKTYILSFCARFTDKGVILSSNDTNNLYIGTAPSPTDVSNSSPCTDELSCKWYYYFKTIGNDPSVMFKNDFIKKTQIVPPVCPQCPNCTGVGVCSTCGGHGGSGSIDSSGSLIRDAAKGTGGLLRDTASGTVGLAKDAVGGTVDLAKDAVGGTVGLAKDTVGGTVGLAKDAVGGTVDLAKDTVGGTVGLVKDAVGGTVGLAKDALGGTVNLFTGNYNGQRSDSGFGYVPGQGNTPVDKYSYYGATQSKGSNFMPVTADFSAFSK